MKPYGTHKLNRGLTGRDAAKCGLPKPKGGRASEKRIAGLMAELELGSADDALREANRIRASLPRGKVPG